ncbi:MAG: RsmB/NOP family class I SAM-dependent RNA methyltransferase [Pseudanabaenaceae cyanobacterium SKYGB_i_bin29]|nr:RsmB/NOP family class I SAM-dependent RNA methyltransferase [Pseudanabaenaceae cyanobacterium SKYG29]MDW8422501.1 RsmB/NOP family class I SAM-dependent RNA methyltransferase [Pseudanabaenaceae cyanobacterium SKYGB_i_bin29]
MVSSLLVKLSRQLYTEEDKQLSFIQALTEPQPLHPSILWCHDYQPKPFPCLTPFPWQPSFTDRLPVDSRPGKHQLHDQGYYYCLDLSSIFAASVLMAIPEKVEVVFDLCAAPGGKAIFAWRLWQPQMLYVNEVIAKRSWVLAANLKRCRISNYYVLQSDVEFVASKYAEQGEVVIVDAPCTGQSLLAKQQKNEGCFHPTMITRNAQRQRRILANAAKIVQKGGYLAYMTCTYSPEENEENVAWFLQRFPHFQAQVVHHLAEYQSHLTPIPCYRLMPQSYIGAGAFTVLLKRYD